MMFSIGSNLADTVNHGTIFLKKALLYKCNLEMTSAKGEAMFIGLYVNSAKTPSKNLFNKNMTQKSSHSFGWKMCIPAPVWTLSETVNNMLYVISAIFITREEHISPAIQNLIQLFLSKGVRR